MRVTFLFVFILCASPLTVMADLHRVSNGYVVSPMASRLMQCLGLRTRYVGECVPTRQFSNLPPFPAAISPEDSMFHGTCSLWCVRETRNGALRCLNTFERVLDNTPCGPNAVCRNGLCLELPRPRIPPNPRARA